MCRVIENLVGPQPNHPYAMRQAELRHVEMVSCTLRLARSRPCDEKQGCSTVRVRVVLPGRVNSQGALSAVWLRVMGPILGQGQFSGAGSGSGRRVSFVSVRVKESEPHRDRVGAGVLGDLERVHPRVGAVLDLFQSA